MTDPAIEQAAILGPTAALRQQTTGSQREMLISRRPGQPGSTTVGREWAELERRWSDFERLAQRS